MKTSYVQVFDKEDAAVEALGYMTKDVPGHRHSMVKSSNQVQVWTDVKGVADAKAYGAPNADPIYLVLSIAPD